MTDPAPVLDYNHRPTMAESVNGLIDAGLEAGDRATPPRTYLGGSRLGHPCERALQFEYAQRAEGRGRRPRGPDAAHLRHRPCAGGLWQQLAARPPASISTPARATVRTAASSASPSPAGASAATSTASSPTARQLPGLGYPALWECKTMNARSWRETAQKGVVLSKPVYAAQLAVYQAYMEGSVAGISANPALFTAINKDTAELHHELVPFDGALAQRMSDRAVRILQATEAGELLPRIAANPDHHECRMCAWSQRCWGLPA